MRQNPDYALDDEPAIRALIRAHPFVTLVSSPLGGLIASHYAVLLDGDGPGITVIGHVGRPDERRHELGQHEVLLIVAGPHGYISPSWYDEPGEPATPAVPTWNFTVAHLYGVPELLSDEENLAALVRLVDHFEAAVPEPRTIGGTGPDAQYAQRIKAGTIGFRLTATRVEAKAKLGQDQPAAVRDRVLAELDGTGAYAHPALAAAMRRGY